MGSRVVIAPKISSPLIIPTPVTEYKRCNFVSFGENATRKCLSACPCSETATPDGAASAQRPPRHVARPPPRPTRPLPLLPAALTFWWLPCSRGAPTGEGGVEPKAPTLGRRLFSLTGIFPPHPLQRNTRTTARA